MKRLRLATDLDWWRYFGRPLPNWWVGIVAEDRHMLLGLGGVYLGNDGRLWACFAKVRGANVRVLMHRAAKTLLRSLPEAGVDEVVALADNNVAGSDVWLARLGFVPTDEMIETHKVYRWTP